MTAPTIKLNDGNSIPQLGLCTSPMSDAEVAPAVVSAIEAGYRHIDCARIYANEKVRMAAQCATLCDAYAAACEAVHLPSLRRRVDGCSLTACRG